MGESGKNQDWREIFGAVSDKLKLIILYFVFRIMKDVKEFPVRPEKYWLNNHNTLSFMWAIKVKLVL